MVLALKMPEIGKVNCILSRDLDVLLRARSRVNSTLNCHACHVFDFKKIMVLALI